MSSRQDRGDYEEVEECALSLLDALGHPSIPRLLGDQTEMKARLRELLEWVRTEARTKECSPAPG